MVELKAIELNDNNLNQCRNYLEAYNLPVGLLLIWAAKAFNTKEFIIQNIRKQKKDEKLS